MKLRAKWLLAVLTLVLSGCVAAPLDAPLLPEADSGRSQRTLRFGERDMVAAANPFAVDAGVTMLARGGSAVDAAIAVQMVLNLVEPQSSGIGGGGFLLHHAGTDGRLRVYDGRETAPAEATDRLLTGPDGQVLRKRDAIDGGLSVGTPGLLRMLEVAHRDHGRLPWKTLFEPAIRLAEQGFPISPRLASAISAAAPRLCVQPAARAYFLLPGGCAPKPAGTLLRNPEFAGTLRAVAGDGADALHHGPLAQAIVDAVRGHPVRPGRLSPADLADYRPKVRDAVCGDYRGHRVCGPPPPSSGGITLLQTLGILSHFEVAALPLDGLDRIHLLTEAYRLAYADRARHLADADFVPVPRDGLLDPAYLRGRAARIRMDRSIGVAEAGSPTGSRASADDRSPTLPSTTHVSIVDSNNDAVSMTTSIEHGLGSLVMVGGFLLNNQLTDFSFTPTDPGGRPVANRVEPGKRPLSTMAPLMVFDADGRLQAVLGSPGGIAIVPFVVKTLTGLIDHGLDLQRAIDAPNFGAENAPLTWLERGSPLTGLADGLKRRGHEVGIFELNSGVHAIVRNGDAEAPGVFSRVPGAGRWVGAADPRREGEARGTSGRPSLPERNR